MGAPAAPVPQPDPTGVTTTLSGKHQARIKIKGKRYDLGSYDTIEEAMDIYSNAKCTGKPERGYAKREAELLDLLVAVLAARLDHDLAVVLDLGQRGQRFLALGHGYPCRELDTPAVWRAYGPPHVYPTD